MKLLFAFALIVLLPALTACAAQVTPTPTLASYSVQSSGTYWERSPTTIVFRSDVTLGKQDPFLTNSDVPNCTVYGDNRVVWTNDLGPYNEQVLYDQVPDDRIKLFVDGLVLSERFYDYPSQASVQIPGSAKASIEIMQLNVEGKAFSTDSLSGWDSTYYQNILSRCRSISTSPVLYVATSGWLSVRSLPYQSQLPSILWNKQASGLDLAQVATGPQPYWITNSNVPVLWNILHTSERDVQLMQDDKAYQIALEVPNVTRASPPAPQPTPAPTAG